MRLAGVVDTFNDFVRKWQGCFVRLDLCPGEPLILRASRSHEYYLSFETESMGQFHLPYNNETVRQLDLFVPVPGYRQCGNRALLLMKTADRQWTRGLSNKNYTTLCPIDEVWKGRIARWSVGPANFNFNICRSFLEEYTYPTETGTAHDALVSLAKGKSKLLSIPLGRNWAVSLNPVTPQLNLYYLLHHVADLDHEGKLFWVSPDRAALHQEVRDFVRRHLGYQEVPNDR